MSKKRMYLLVRKDLSPSQRIVQAAHACAEFCLYDNLNYWDNGIMVCLGVENEDHLKEEASELEQLGVCYRDFKEPDIGNQMTALALVSDKKMFEHLDLI